MSPPSAGPPSDTPLARPPEGPNSPFLPSGSLDPPPGDQRLAGPPPLFLGAQPHIGRLTGMGLLFDLRGLRPRREGPLTLPSPCAPAEARCEIPFWPFSGPAFRGALGPLRPIRLAWARPGNFRPDFGNARTAPGRPGDHLSLLDLSKQWACPRAQLIPLASNRAPQPWRPCGGAWGLHLLNLPLPLGRATGPLPSLCRP